MPMQIPFREERRKSKVNYCYRTNAMLFLRAVGCSSDLCFTERLYKYFFISSHTLLLPSIFVALNFNR